jgi:hypothetical protein
MPTVSQTPLTDAAYEPRPPGPMVEAHVLARVMRLLRGSGHVVIGGVIVTRRGEVLSWAERLGYWVWRQVLEAAKAGGLPRVTRILRDRPFVGAAARVVHDGVCGQCLVIAAPFPAIPEVPPPLGEDYGRLLADQRSAALFPTIILSLIAPEAITEVPIIAVQAQQETVARELLDLIAAIALGHRTYPVVEDGQADEMADEMEGESNGALE